MALVRVNESTISFHKMDAAIRKAAAARKRGDSEQESFWMGEMRKFAEMHKKAVKNENAGISENNPSEEKPTGNRLSREQRQKRRMMLKF